MPNLSPESPPPGTRKLSWWLMGLPFLLMSIGLHGLVFRIPLPASNQPVPLGSNETQNGPEAEDVSSETMQVVTLPQPTPDTVSSADSPVGSAPLDPQTSLNDTLPSAAPETPESSVPKPAIPSLASSAPVEPPVVTTPPPPTEPQELLPDESTDVPPAESPRSDGPENLSSPTTPPEPRTLAERLQTSSAYVFNHSTKADGQGTADYLAWYAAVSEELNIPLQSGKHDLDPLQVIYPLTTCLSTPPALGRLGVVIDTEGNLVQDPTLLASTGYDVLDEQALTLVADYEFPIPEGVTTYGLPVVVNYEATQCTPASP